jgi:hypothetical protein
MRLKLFTGLAEGLAAQKVSKLVETGDAVQ